MTVLYSIGYGNRDWHMMLDLLQRRACQFLIDVRSSPYSKFNPTYNRESLASLCGEQGIRYVFMGDVLGGKPGRQEHFDSEGKVDYVKLAKSEQFQLGLSRLKSAQGKGLVSFLMCSELKPEMCHRCKLIGAELSKHGIEILHVDENGVDIGQGDAIDRLTHGQSDMFGISPVLTRSRGSYGAKT